jgi:predicted acylesterase/phospholipase RssA
VPRRRCLKTPDPGTEPTLGLCIVGGGFLGALRALGMLAGVEEALAERCPKGLPLRVLVGSRSGALLGALLASGMRPKTVIDRVKQPGSFAMGVGGRARFELGHVADLLRELALALWRRGREAVRDPLGVLATDEMQALLGSMPPGLLKPGTYETYLNRLFWEHGLPRYFEECAVPLRVLAWDLDMGKPLVLGREGTEGVSIPNAVAAATAMPAVFSPARVGGRDVLELPPGQVTHLEVACHAGAERLLVVVPSPPARGTAALGGRAASEGPRVGELGLAGVWTQTQRQTVLSGVHEALARHARVRPEVPVSVLAPPLEGPQALLQTSARAANREEAINAGVKAGRRAAAEGSALRELLGL